MTEPASHAVPPPMTLPCLEQSAGGAVFDEEMTSGLTRIVYRDFWFSPLTYRRYPARWVEVCNKDDTITGLYAVVTADVNALTAVLTLDRAGEPGTARQERRRETSCTAPSRPKGHRR